ncbi:dolichyl-phosphate-mannose-protein mannosyltransferase [Bacteriovorax sp. Seq25_V]|nr:dolichyl-phosphate-mannose-protein mannosyltransferase [Bacteriovorax sp. Seq25_V]
MSVHKIIPADIIYGINDQQDILVSDKAKGINEKTYLTKNIVSRNSTPILTFKIVGKEFPIKFSARHGGLGLSLYKILNYVFNENTFAIWHALFKSLAALLFFFALRNFIGQRKSSIATMMLVIDPMFLTSYFVFITELINLTSMMILFYIFSRKQEINSRGLFLVGALIGFNLYLRLNFLWMIVWVIPIFYTKESLRQTLTKKRVSLFFIGGFLGGALFLYRLDISRLLAEVSLVMQSWDPTHLIFYFVRLLMSPTAYNQYFLEVGSALTVPIETILCMFVLLLVFGKVNFSEMNKKILLGIFLSLLTVYFCTRAGENYFLYLSFLIIPIYFFVFTNKIRIKPLVIILFLRFLVFSSAYYGSGVLAIFDYKTNEQVWNKAAAFSGKKIVNLSDSDHGKGNYLGHNLEIYNLNRYFYEYDNMTINLALALFGQDGVLILPERDIWGAWYQNQGIFDYQKFEEMARRDGIEIIEYDHVKKKEGTGYYIINYKFKK